MTRRLIPTIRRSTLQITDERKRTSSTRHHESIPGPLTPMSNRKKETTKRIAPVTSSIDNIGAEDKMVSFGVSPLTRAIFGLALFQIVNVIGIIASGASLLNFLLAIAPYLEYDKYLLSFQWFNMSFLFVGSVICIVTAFSSSKPRSSFILAIFAASWKGIQIVFSIIALVFLFSFREGLLARTYWLAQDSYQPWVSLVVFNFFALFSAVAETVVAILFAHWTRERPGVIDHPDGYSKMQN